MQQDDFDRPGDPKLTKSAAAFGEGETVNGWGVVRNAPWHFVGMYPTREAAEAKAREMGNDYVARYGINRSGTNNFIWTTLENPDEGEGAPTDAPTSNISSGGKNPQRK